ncbi:MAG: proteasome assembly chaperone family protein [Promethearchaeota archaeon]
MSEDPNCLSGRVCPRGEKTEMVIYEKDIEADGATFVLGFAGLGLVGNIATSHLVQQVDDMRLIGHVESKEMPPVVPFYEGVLKQPFRIYYSKNYHIIVGFCETPLRSESFNDIANELMYWAGMVNIKDVALLQGLASDMPFPPEDHPVYCAAEVEVFDKLKAHDIDQLPKGVIMGLEAAILINCLNSKLDGYALITPVSASGIPSPEGAAALLEKLSSIYNIPIDTKELHEQGLEIKKKMMELAQVAQRQASQNNIREGMVTTHPGDQFFV